MVISLVRWGDKSLAGGKSALKLRHRDCGRDIQPLVICVHCHRELDPRRMDISLNHVI